jgi:ABC-type multidrug transport system ATPase subunit
LLFAYVAQHDTFHESLTPREALAFSAKLRSGSNEKVDSLIRELGLESVADTKVCSLSGGERKRTSIGIELISNPSILLLDEPTSGLDSFATKHVLGLLQKMARTDNTVLFTIHQPSSDVFSSFDHLILLHKGRMMYQGLTRDIPMDYERKGYKVPANYNPADWILVRYAALRICCVV